MLRRSKKVFVRTICFYRPIYRRGKKVFVHTICFYSRHCGGCFKNWPL